MLGPLFTLFALFALLTFFVFAPLITYFIDRKHLRRFPNASPIAGITNLWYMLETALGHRSQTLLEKHKTNPILRVGPNHLSFSNPQAIKDIYGHGTKITKDDFYKALAGTHRHVADVQDRAEHSRKRKVLAGAYALKSIVNWEHIVADKVSRLIKQFDKRCTAPPSPAAAVSGDAGRGYVPDPSELTVDYRFWTNLFTFDAIADIGLSEKLGFLDAGDDLTTAETPDGRIYKARLRESLHGGVENQSKFVWVGVDWYGAVKKITGLLPWFRSGWKANEAWNDIVLHQTRKRLNRGLQEGGEKLDDFFTSLWVDKNGQPNNLEFGELMAEISIMLNAGSDTTAISLTNALYNLLKNPHHLSTLRAELDSALLPTDIVAPYDKLKHLPFLRAVLDESLRLHPPTTFGLPRVTPPEGAAVTSEFIPGNTTVSISAYVAHRDPEIFPEPEEFRPQRWLDDDDNDDNNNNNKSKRAELQPYFITFSAGARGCIGRNISYLEQTMVLASVVRRYGFALQSEDWCIERVEGFNTWPGRMGVKVWRRTYDGGCR